MNLTFSGQRESQDEEVTDKLEAVLRDERNDVRRFLFFRFEDSRV